MPVIAWWIVGGAVSLVATGAAGWKAADEIGDQLDKARPYLIGLGAAYVAVLAYKQVRG